MRKLCLLVYFILIVISSCFSEDFSEKAEVLITAKEGGIVVLGQASVVIPPEALSVDTIISITRIEEIEETGDSISNATDSYGGYRFLPAGTKFNKEVIVSIPYKPELNGKTQVLNDTYTYFYDVNSKNWVQLKRVSIDKENCIIKSATTHFTDMINATLTMPETASPVDFNLNSIKSLEAATADTNILRFNPPQANYTGDTSFSFDLQIPQGRNGVQPSLALIYSSSIGNGILGRGFDINYGSVISIDTRKKLPEYNENDEYILDGIQLKEKEVGSNYIEYELKKKTSYQTIRRYNPWGENGLHDYWEVKSANGITSIYGNVEDSTLGVGEKVFSWYLTSITDIYGNAIIFNYKKDAGYVYPDEIKYTVDATNNYKYTIKFNYLTEREDIRIDARSGNVVACNWLLNNICCFIENKQFRKYEFVYSKGVSDVNLLTKFVVCSSILNDILSSEEKVESYEYEFKYHDIESNEYFATPKPLDKPISLNEGFSYSFGVNGYVSGGAGVGRNTWDIRSTVGGTFSSSTSYSQTNSTYLDINGDGYPDYITQKGKKLKIYLGNGKGAFGSEHSIDIANYRIDNEETSTSSTGKNVYVGAGLKTDSISFGYKFNENKSNSSIDTDSMFIDVDGDGLVDFVLDTKNYLHNESNGTSVKFTKKNITNFPDFIINKLTLNEKKDLSKNYPVNRPLRAWRAPYAGEVEITESLETQNRKFIANTYLPDNTTQTISFDNDYLELGNINLNVTDTLYFLPDVGDDIPIEADENRNKSGKWNVELKYTSVKPFLTYERLLKAVLPKEEVVEKYEIITIENERTDTDIVWEIEDTQLKPLYLLKDSKTAVLNSKWKYNLNEDIVAQIIDKLYFVPVSLDLDELFNLSLIDRKELLKVLQEYYVYESSNNKLYLRDCDDEKLVSLHDYFINNDNEFLKKYVQNNPALNLKPKYHYDSETDSLCDKYEIETTETLVTSSNGIESCISTTDFGKILIFNIDLGDDFLYSVKELDDESYAVSLENNNYSLNEVVKEEDDSLLIELIHKDGKYTKTLVLSEKKEKIDVISEDEFEYIIQKYSTFAETVDSILDKIKNEIRKKQKHSSSEEDEEAESEIFVEEEDLYEYFKASINSGYLTQSDVNILLNENLNETDKELFLQKYGKALFAMENEAIFKKNDNYWIVLEPQAYKYKYENLINYKFENIKKIISYNKDSSYTLDNNIIVISILNESGIFEESEISLSKVIFDSGKDFETTNIELSVESDEQDANNYFDKAFGLYGGKSNWYYGFWVGTEEENPFSIENLNKCFENNLLNTDELQSLSEDNSSSYTEKLNKNTERNVLYLPTEQLIVNNKTTVKESETSRYVGAISESDSNEVFSGLYGSISINTTTKVINTEDEISFQNIESYYLPYICNDILNCSRTGGNTYYSLDGMPEYTSVKTLVRTSTESTETSHSVDGGITDSTTELGISANLSYHKNEGSTKNLQAFRDITGDRIPDVLMIQNNQLVIYEGILSNNKDLSFIEIDKKMNISSISSNCNSGTGGDGSLGPEGVFKVSYTSTGKVKSVGFNGAGGFKGTDEQTSALFDINGDGLNDYVTNQNVIFGFGSTLLSDSNVKFEGGFAQKSKSSGFNTSVTPSFGSGLSQYDIFDKSMNFIETLINPEKEDLLKYDDSSYLTKISTIDAGISLGGGFTVSNNNVTEFLCDINGDGLPDKICQDENKIIIYYNIGNKFSDGKEINIEEYKETVERTDSDGNLVTTEEVLSNSLQSTSSISLSENLSTYLNTSCSLPIFWGLKLKILIGMGSGLNCNQSFSSVTTKLIDIDGDGLPDQLVEFANGKVYYRKNMLGKTDLIKEIHFPQGGKCSIDYSEVPATFEMPSTKMTLSSVTLSDNSQSDGTDKMPYTSIGNHESTITYEYENGAYNRNEYDFYGYELVKTYNTDGTYTEQLYSNDISIYPLKGYPLATKQYTGENYESADKKDKLIMLQKSYPSNRYLNNEVLTDYVETEYYETDGTSALYSKSEFDYDEWLNVTEVIDTFDKNNSNSFITNVKYLKDVSKHLYSLPTLVEGYSNSNGVKTLVRKREGKYENGSLTELNQYYNENSALKTTFHYDAYGNIDVITDSTNSKIEITYDGTYHQYAEKISQSGDGTDTYTTSVSYDKLTQTKIKETDANKLSMIYEYDSWQRPIAIYSPYDTTKPCVSYEYYTPKNNLWYAITNNKVVFDDDSDIIKTIVLQDGLGRIIQTAKTGYVCEDAKNEVFEKGWNVSGATFYDNKGRLQKQGQSYFVSGAEINNIVNQEQYNLEFKNPVENEYDFRDRVIKSDLPDGSIVYNEYTVVSANDEESIKGLVNGTLQKTIAIDQNGNKTIQFTDVQGNIVAILKTDSANNVLTKTYYEYDFLGQMLNAYDSVGNPISVKYDLLGRTISLSSLDSGEKRYYYDDSPNLLREDDSRLRAMNRNIVYEYDGLNRLVKISHCFQGDTVFEYGGANETDGNLAGKLKSVKEDGTSVSYRYGLLGEIIEENRTITSHTANIGQTEKSATMKYKSDYLGRMQTITYPDNEIVTYSYDYGGQVFKIEGIKGEDKFEYVNNIGYNEDGQRVFIEYGNEVKTYYTYDDKRKWLSNIYTITNTDMLLQNIDYEFDLVGNIKRYTNNCLDGGNYSTVQSYTYDALYQLISVNGTSIYNKNHTVVPNFQSEYTQVFEFDDKGLGNMTSKVSSERLVRGSKPDSNLNYNLNYVYQDGYAHRLKNVGNRFYDYDENGNLIREYDKSQLGDEPDALFAVDILAAAENNNPVYGVEGAWGYGYEKKDSNSFGDANFERIYEWDDKNQLIKTKDGLYTTYYVYNNEGDRVAKYTERSETLYFNKFWSWHIDPANAFAGGQLSKHIFLGDTRIVTKLSQETNNYIDAEKQRLYFYHSDHLGSASLITDYKGNEYERLEYTPYGELWVDLSEYTGSTYLPFKFSAKEMDSETGLYYYGARYLDSKYSLWKSTDPALGEYIPKAPVNEQAKQYNQNLPGMGGIFNPINANLYHYAGNNPVRYVDPDGKSDYAYYNKDDYNIYCFMNNEISLCKAENLFDFKRDFVKNVVLFDDNGEIVKEIYGKENIQTFFDSLKEPQKWTRENTENLCSFNGVVLGIGIGVSIFICPAITPWLICASLANDAVNVGCRAIDYYENPTKDNKIELGFGIAGFIFDGVSFLSLQEIGLLSGNLAKSPLFSFSINSMGRPYYASNGQFMKYSTARLWFGTDFLVVPCFTNYGSIIFTENNQE